MKLIKEESYQDGFEQCIEQSKSQMQQLISVLISENRVDDLQRACKDTMPVNQIFSHSPQGMAYLAFYISHRYFRSYL